MSKFNKIALVIFLLLAAGLTYLEALEPEPLNWSPSYSATDKIPLGTYILFENLRQHFPEIEIVKQPSFEFLTSGEPKGTYVFVNNQVSFDEAELGKLLDWVKKGNNVFASSDAFSKNILDSLNLNVKTLVPSVQMVSQPMVNLVNPEYKSEQAYLFDKDTYHSIFSELDTLNHTVLGISQLFEEERKIEAPEVNFVKVPVGEGDIFLHTTPQAFSNYFILEDGNMAYVENALAYLPREGTIYWDEYKKAGKTFQTSLLYILLDNKALKWAYYFVLLGALLFVLFEGKRKQRSIPVLKPLENQTYNFTKTIAGLYLDRKDYKNIAEKKINLFLEHIRTHYRVSTETINEEFYLAVSVQTECSLVEIKALFRIINKVEAKKQISKNELQELNSAIEAIKKSR